MNVKVRPFERRNSNAVFDPAVGDLVLVLPGTLMLEGSTGG